MEENLKNLIVAVPVIGVLLYFLNYFIKNYEEEKKINKERDKQDSEIIVGLKNHIEESNKKQTEVSYKIDDIHRKLDK